MAVYFAASHRGSPNLSRTSLATDMCGRMTLSSRFPSNLGKEEGDAAIYLSFTRQIRVLLPNSFTPLFPPRQELESDHCLGSQCAMKQEAFT